MRRRSRGGCQTLHYLVEAGAGVKRIGDEGWERWTWAEVQHAGVPCGGGVDDTLQEDLELVRQPLTRGGVHVPVAARPFKETRVDVVQDSVEANQRPVVGEVVVATRDADAPIAPHLS